MLRIRPSQLGQTACENESFKTPPFHIHAQAQLAYAIIKHLRAEHSLAVDQIPDDLLALMIRNGIARAQRYKLTTIQEVGTFVALMFEVAPGFDEQSVVHQCLSRFDIQPEDRFQQLLEEMKEPDWAEASTFRAEHFWFPKDELTHEEN